jgi:hypothetical protein
MSREECTRTGRSLPSFCSPEPLCSNAKLKASVANPCRRFKMYVPGEGGCLIIRCIFRATHCIYHREVYLPVAMILLVPLVYTGSIADSRL